MASPCDHLMRQISPIRGIESVASDVISHVGLIFGLTRDDRETLVEPDL